MGRAARTSLTSLASQSHRFQVTLPHAELVGQPVDAVDRSGTKLRWCDPDNDWRNPNIKIVRCGQY
jgi:hypothetical protein